MKNKNIKPYAVVEKLKKNNPFKKKNRKGLYLLG